MIWPSSAFVSLLIAQSVERRCPPVGNLGWILCCCIKDCTYSLERNGTGTASWIARGRGDGRVPLEGFVTTVIMREGLEKNALPHSTALADLTLQTLFHLHSAILPLSRSALIDASPRLEQPTSQSFPQNARLKSRFAHPLQLQEPAYSSLSASSVGAVPADCRKPEI
jgi:hypothetical protein